MNNDVVIITEHLNGSIAPITHELLGCARAVTAQTGGRVLAVISGFDLELMNGQLSAADTVITIENRTLAEFTPEIWQTVLHRVLDEKRPRLILLGSTSIGIDLAAALSELLAAPMVCGCRDIRAEGDALVLTSQLYGGKIFIESVVEGETVIAQLLPGSCAPAQPGTEHPVIESIILSVEPQDFRSRFISYLKPDEGDIDIAQYPVLVSVGRGIQSRDNIALAEELAEALGGAVSSSRPVVDQDWLPITRQVGKSGMTVKPKLYLALGISGAPEHLEGMKDADLIVAVNSDRHAPIFSVAHYGIEADVLDFIPELTEKLRETVT